MNRPHPKGCGHSPKALAPLPTSTNHAEQSRIGGLHGNLEDGDVGKTMIAQHGQGMGSNPGSKPAAAPDEPSQDKPSDASDDCSILSCPGAIRLVQMTDDATIRPWLKAEFCNLASVDDLDDGRENLPVQIGDLLRGHLLRQWPLAGLQQLIEMTRGCRLNI